MGLNLTERTFIDEIHEIADEYDRQLEMYGDVDTPGGIENKFDAFRLIKKWSIEIRKNNMKEMFGK